MGRLDEVLQRFTDEELEKLRRDDFGTELNFHDAVASLYVIARLHRVTWKPERSGVSRGRQGEERAFVACRTLSR